MSRLILALALAAGAAQDMAPAASPKLEFRAPAKGDKVEIKIESTFELDISSSSVQEPDAVSTKQLAFTRTLECVQTFQGDEGGAKTWSVACPTAKVQRSGTNLAPVTESSEIEGKTFTVTRNDKGRAVKMENGDPAPGDAGGFGAWEDCSSLLPKGDAKEGATWSVDAAAISALISIPDMTTPTGTFEAKLEKMADGQAVVVFTGTLEGKTVKGFDTKLKVAEGRLVFDIAKGRPASLSITGSLEATKDINQKVQRANELRQVDEKVGTVQVKSRKLEVKAEFR
jgi:hypothetical protein